MIIAWDWNGTLLDDVDVCLDVTNTMLERRGMPLLTKEQYRDIFQFPVEGYYRKVGFTFETESFEELSAEYINSYYRQVWPLMPKALAVLAEFRQKGWHQVILSASRQDYLDQQVTAMGCRPWISETRGITDIYAHSKQKLIEAWIEEQANRDEICFVGDTQHDAHIARACGCRCVLVAQGHQSKDVLCQCEVPVLDTLEQLPELLADPKFWVTASVNY